MSQQASCIQKRGISIFFTMLFLGTAVLAVSPCFSAETVVVPQEEVEMLKDYGNAFKDSISETKSELENILKKYTLIKDKFGNHKHPKILSLINYLDRNNLGKHLKNAVSVLGKYEGGIKKVTTVMADVESIVAFYDNYKPDKNNPLRSLEQISSALEELNTIIVKIDPSDGMLTKPVRVMVELYQKSVGAFHGALSRVRKKIKERGGGGIGLGFSVDTDKERLFRKKFPNETAYRYPWIKYIKPGLSEEEAEFWDNKSDRAFAWRDNDWIEIKSGIAGLRKVYDGIRLATGRRPDLNTLISRCNTGWEELLQAERGGERYFKLFFSGNSCVPRILAYKKIRLEHFPEEKFIARYVFRKDIRRKIDRAVELVKNSLLVEGKVTEEKYPDRGLANIPISAEASGARVDSISEPGGWFTLLFKLKPSENRSNARVTIHVSGYKAYSRDWPLRQQCSDWYNINLIREEELVEVPGLIGQKATSAGEKLAVLKLVPVRTDGGMPPSIDQSDVIVWQNPAKGTMVAKGTEVSFQAYWLVSDDVSSPSDDEARTEPEVTTGPETSTEPETVDGNKDNTSDGLEGYVGGLMIAGKTEIISGEGVSYTACDGAGKPYPADGSFSWNSSVEDVLVLGRSGQPVTGSGFKAGTSTIVLHFDGMTKFLDVKVRVKVPDVTGMSIKQAAGSIEGLNLRTSVSGNGQNTDELAVVSQIPAPGTIVDADTAIFLEPGEKKAGLFSMSGGEKVEENESIFSMSGGEKKSDQNAAKEDSDTGISLSGSNSNNALAENRNQSQSADSSNVPDNSIHDSSEQKLIILWHSLPSYRTDAKLWYFYGNSWGFGVKLQNVSSRDIAGKTMYLLVKINNRVYYHYFSSVRPGCGQNKYSDTDLELYVRIPTNAAGTNTFEISCPALPRIPALRQQIASDPPDKYKLAALAAWRKNLSPSAYNKLSRLKQRYDQALGADPNGTSYWYHIVRSSHDLAEALVIVAESYCGYGKFQPALEMNALAIDVLKTHLSAHGKKMGPMASGTPFDYLIDAYKRQANIYLMGLHDSKGYLENGKSALKFLFKKYEFYMGKDNSKGMRSLSKKYISTWAMRIAENLLTLGFKKTDVKPYYDIGIRYMEKKDLEAFKNFRGNLYDDGATNCRELFINRPNQ